jgi:glycosyltransferase involved in cell wall biosynthesis
MRLNKIKIAFIKFGGLSAGGTEKFLQTIAANLDKHKFDVDYFYCDSAPYENSNYKHADTDLFRKEYMISHGVNLIKFTVGSKDISTYTHDWKDTNFWELFNEDNYDLIQTGRAGHPEYPFTLIKTKPIVDSIHTLGGFDNQYNISRVMHITKWSAEKWVKMGGDKKRVVHVSHPLQISTKKIDLRDELKISKSDFVYGFHQRVSDDIFSPLPLQAYKEIEDDDTCFMLMGGSILYSEQAKNLKIKKFFQLPHSGHSEKIFSFLQTLNVYAHGRKDGELNSTAMAEAMFFNLPIVSHTAEANGHIECIGDGGNVVHNETEYSKELMKLKENKDYYSYRSQKSRERFEKNYELSTQINHITSIYEDILKDPFPHSKKRIYLHVLNETKKYLCNRYTISLYRSIKSQSKKL